MDDDVEPTSFPLPKRDPAMPTLEEVIALNEVHAFALTSIGGLARLWVNGREVRG